MDGKLRGKIQDSKYAATSQRQAVLHALEALNGQHPSAEEVYIEAKKRRPRIGMGTVYATLSIFEELGIVEAKYWAGSPARYDLNTDPHYDVLCTACGKVEAIPGVEFVDFRSRLEVYTPYSVTNAMLTIEGICPDCPEKNKVHETVVGT
jgi:Fe2+ or Zn2+ uptake regulation protein